MEQWNERQQLLAAKLDEIRKRPGNLLTGWVSMNSNTTEKSSFCINIIFIMVIIFISIFIFLHMCISRAVHDCAQ